MSAPKISFNNGVQTPESRAPKISFDSGIRTPESSAPKITFDGETAKPAVSLPGVTTLPTVSSREKMQNVLSSMSAADPVQQQARQDTRSFVQQYAQQGKQIAADLAAEEKRQGAIMEELSQINNGTAILTDEGRARAAELEAELKQVQASVSALSDSTDIDYNEYLTQKYDGKSGLFKAAASIGKNLTSSPLVVLETLETAVQNVQNNRGNTQENGEIAVLTEELSRIQNGTDILTDEGRARAAEIEARLSELMRDTAGESVDMTSPAMRGMEEAVWLQNSATENIKSPVVKFLADTGISIGQNAAVMPLALANPALPLVAMGTSAAAQKMYDVSSQGGSAGEALGRGLVSGGIEALTEKLPLDSVYDLVKTGGKGVLKNLLKQGGVEATEEGLSYALNYLADKAARDPKATWDWNDFATSMAAGGLSGLFFGLGGTAVNKVTGLPGSGIEGAETINQERTTPVEQTRQTTPVELPTVNQTTEQVTTLPMVEQQNQKLNIDNAVSEQYNNLNEGGMNNGTQLHRTSGEGVRTGQSGAGYDSVAQEGTPRNGQGNLRVSGIVLLSPKSQQTLNQRGVVNVELRNSSADNAAFSSALDAARSADARNGWAVTPKNVEELSGTRTFMDTNGTTGFAIAQDGDIEAVFANKAAGAPKGVTQSTIPQAIANGGTKLDCYGPGLVDLYRRYGFIPVARTIFNPEYANEGWTADKGTPDIYFMMHNGDSADTVVENYGKYRVWTKAELDALPVMEYDDAYAYRDSLMQGKQGVAGQNKTASTGETEYRATRPENVEMPTVPIINLSMQDVADLNGGELPTAGNYIRKTATEQTEKRLGLDKNPAVYIEASNVTRNGDAYVIKLTKQSLKKMLSASSYESGVVPLESIAVLNQIERIAQNGVYYKSEGDRYGRDQIAGYDHLMTTVYIDNAPYVVDMRVRVADQPSGDGNTLYHFTPETIEVTKKNDSDISTTGRHASSIKSETPLSSNTTILNNEPGVKKNSAQNSQNNAENKRFAMSADGLADEVTVDGYGRNTVGAAQAQFPYQEAKTQSVADRMFTEREMQEHDLESRHQVITNKESRHNAEWWLEYDYEGEVERLKTEEWGPTENVEGHMILENLVEQARKTGTAEDWAKVREWKKLYDQKGGTEAGQTLQSRARYADSAANITAEAADFLDSKEAKNLKQGKRIAVIETVAEQSEALENIAEGDTDALIDLIERNSEIRRTTGLFRKKTSRQMDWALHKVAELYPDADSFLRGVAASQTRGIYTDYAKTSLTEKAKSLRVQLMLSKIATVMRNFVSNNVFDPLETLSNDVGLLADLVMSKATGQRTTAFEKSWASKAKRAGSLEGALKSFIEVGLDADSEGPKYEGTGGRTFKMTGNPVERFLSTWSKFQNYTLTTTDEFQKGGIRAETQENIDKLKRSGKLDADSLNEWAGETAKQRTFQNDSKLSKSVSKLKQGANDLFHVGDIGAGDILVPFAKVPSNLVAQAANYSPVGIANGVIQMAQVMYNAKNGDYSAEAQAQAARNIGRGLTGTGLLAAFAALATKGVIDVAGADDEDKEALEKAQGRNGTQWNLSATLRAAKGESTEWQDGDTLMSIGFLDPINSIMAAGAMIADAYKEDGTLTGQEITDASLSALVQAVLDLPAMSSINELITTAEYADGETAGEKARNTAKDYAAGEIESFIIPNALRGIATGLDDTVRNRYSGEGFIEQAKEGVISGTPFARKTLPASIDPFGREKTQTGNTALNILNNNLLPGALTKYKETDVEKMLENVYDATGNASVYPTKKAPNSFEIDGEKFALDTEQKDEYMTTAGQTAYEIMADLIDSDTFRNMNAEMQAQYLATANEYARAVAKAEVSDGKYELSGTNKKISTAEDAGMSAADYIMYKLNSEAYNEDGGGAMKISEVAEYVQNSGMSKKEQTAYWLVTYPEWSEKAEEKGVDIEDYINYKRYTYGVEGDKNAKGDTISGSKKRNMIAALVDAGYSQNEAVILYNAINAK